MNLRPYQRSAVDAIYSWIKKRLNPCLLEACTGAGKSHIIAALAHKIFSESGKRVLVLQPSAELVTQNHEKYLLTGEPASIYSASAGTKCLAHPVIFATPMSIKNSLDKNDWSGFALIVIDECDLLTPTVKTIISELRGLNPAIRVVGLTATPYRMGTGYIYATDDLGNPVPSDQTREPYFARRVFNITAHDLLLAGFLTPPLVGVIGEGGYGDHPRTASKTARIMADVVTQSVDRRGVLIFAATVDHAHECMAGLPPDGSAALVTGETPRRAREAIVMRVKAHEIKYIVNVGVFTVGFDAPHIDVIALLRATESPRLLQQIIGRGLRLYPGKADCLVLDYARNLEQHFPDGDIFNPEITASGAKGGGGRIEAVCEICGAVNKMTSRPNPDKLGVDTHGYHLDLDGNRVITDAGPLSAHFGRRCGGLIPVAGGGLEQCGYRWTFKQCPECGAENDIAARKCEACKHILVDPNAKLTLTPSEERNLVLYARLVNIGKQFGYKEGWAKMKYKKRTGRWPTRAMLTNV